MVFKAVTGVGKNVNDVYKSDLTYSEDVIASLNVTDEYSDHYKNRIILKGKTFNRSQVIFLT